MAFIDGKNGENFMTKIFGLPQFGRSDTWKKQSQTDNKIMENYEKKHNKALEKWSEEDDKILNKIVNSLMGAENVDCTDYNIMYNWLESLKQRM